MADPATPTRQNGPWKPLALALLAALLSGAGAVLITGQARSQISDRITAVETRTTDISQRLDRIESKIDVLLERKP